MFLVPCAGTGSVQGRSDRRAHPGRQDAAPLDHRLVRLHYAGNLCEKGMTQMSRETGDRRPGRGKSVLLFAALLIAGLAMLGMRVLARPDVGLAEMILPFLGGLLIAGAIAMIVRRDRQDRESLPPSVRDRQDHGTPN